ncbi:hypothetical protein D9M72_491160 [compost metagenome]
MLVLRSDRGFDARVRVIQNDFGDEGASPDGQPLPGLSVHDPELAVLDAFLARFLKKRELRHEPKDSSRLAPRCPAGASDTEAVVFDHQVDSRHHLLRRLPTRHANTASGQQRQLPRNVGWHGGYKNRFLAKEGLLERKLDETALNRLLQLPGMRVLGLARPERRERIRRVVQPLGGDLDALAGQQVAKLSFRVWVGSSISLREGGVRYLRPS